MVNAWYVVESRPQQEQLAVRNLERQFPEVFLPTCIVKRVIRRRLVELVRPLFPRYMFLSLDLDAPGCRWRSVYGTFGVARILGSGERPQPIASRVVEELQQRCGDGPLADPTYHIGEVVRICAGPWAEELGRVAGTAKGRVYVLLFLFQREMVVPVREDWVRRDA
jgi:transcriptional antiterminator RfaH